MTRPMATLAALLMILGTTPAAAAGRAIWTWEESSYALLEDPAAGESAIAFLRSKKIDTVYLYADAFQGRNLLQDRPELYRRLIRGLHAAGLRVHALLGSAYLHTEEYVLPERRADAVAMFRRVLNYNDSVQADERFDGVNLDIEPHILDQWSGNESRLLGQFLDLGQALMELKRLSGRPLEVGPAIPFWLDGITLEWQGATKPVSEHVIDLFDYAALMDYRNKAEGGDGIISHAMDEMTYAGPRGRKLVIGVDVSPGGLQKTSFNHLAEADLERELAFAECAFRGNPAFAGFAIHHFRTYRDWLSRDRSGEP